jgi:hypothetical protein
MKRHIRGLREMASNGESDLPDGIHLVRVDRAQYRWNGQNPSMPRAFRCSNRKSCPVAWSPGGCSAVHVLSGSWAGSCAISSTPQNCSPSMKSTRRLFLVSTLITSRPANPCYHLFLLHSSEYNSHIHEDVSLLALGIVCRCLGSPRF